MLKGSRIVSTIEVKMTIHGVLILILMYLTIACNRTVKNIPRHKHTVSLTFAHAPTYRITLSLTFAHVYRITLGLKLAHAQTH